METIYGILGFAALIFIGYIWMKAKEATRKALKQKVLYRSEHTEGMELVKKIITFQTEKNVSDFMNEISLHVTALETAPAVLAKIYLLSKTEDRIIFALGNKINPKIFSFIIIFESDGIVTTGTFKTLNWTEYDGIVGAQDSIKKLIREVKESFTAIDTSAKITESIPD